MIFDNAAFSSDNLMKIINSIEKELARKQIQK